MLAVIFLPFWGAGNKIFFEEFPIFLFHTPFFGFFALFNYILKFVSFSKGGNFFKKKQGKFFFIFGIEGGGPNYFPNKEKI